MLNRKKQQTDAFLNSVKLKPVKNDSDFKNGGKRQGDR